MDFQVFVYWKQGALFGTGISSMKWKGFLKWREFYNNRIWDHISKVLNKSIRPSFLLLIFSDLNFVEIFYKFINAMWFYQGNAIRFIRNSNHRICFSKRWVILTASKSIIRWWQGKRANLTTGVWKQSTPNFQKNEHFRR